MWVGSRLERVFYNCGMDKVHLYSSLLTLARGRTILSSSLYGRSDPAQNSALTASPLRNNSSLDHHCLNPTPLLWTCVISDKGSKPRPVLSSVNQDEYPKVCFENDVTELQSAHRAMPGSE